MDFRCERFGDVDGLVGGFDILWPVDFLEAWDVPGVDASRFEDE